MILETVLKIFLYWIMLGAAISALMFSCLMFAKFCDVIVRLLSSKEGKNNV